MTVLADVLVGVWTGVVIWGAFVVLPALALGRPKGRAPWWPELLAGAAWSTLAAFVVVPPLAATHLLNWATALLVPLAWPLALWLYRYRGAPSGEFRALCRRVTLQVLTWHWRPVGLAIGRNVTRIVSTTIAVLTVYWLAARQLRFSSPADYDTLAHTRALLAGGRWIVDPTASLAAVVSVLAAVDPMQALRFLRPLAWPGSLIASALHTPSLNAAWAWTALIAGLVLAAVGIGAVHRRDPWHVVAACAIAACAFSAPGARAEGGYVEYDAAARQTLAIAQTFASTDWTIVAPLEQRVEISDPRRFVPLADFVRRFADRGGDRLFRFDMPGHDLLVFVEKTPLHIEPDAAVMSVGYAPAAQPYRLPNARAALERRALDLCESYRRTHTGVTVYYDDADIRIYHVRH